jgi:hypothetical protein
MPSDNVSVDLSGIINLPVATETTDGLVELADAAETQAGVDNTQAITPAAAAATYIPLSALSAKGDLLTLSGCSTRVALPVGANGQILTACSSSDTGLCWSSLPSPPPPSIPCSCLTGKGALVAGSGVSTPSALPVGLDGQVLTACSTSSTGLLWSTPSSPAIPCSCITGKGALIAGSDVGIPSALPVGANGQILMACVDAPSGLCWATSSAAAIPCACLTGKGALITATADGVPVALPTGSQGQILCVNTQCCTGLEWTNVGKTASIVANSGIIAIAMDNLRVCFTRTGGNRTWAFATVSGNETAITQTTCASDAVIATQRRATTLNSTAFTELGWNFSGAPACATYMICLGPLNAPTAIYCFVGMVGCSYNANLFHLTRLF